MSSTLTDFSEKDSHLNHREYIDTVVTSATVLVVVRVVQKVH